MEAVHTYKDSKKKEEANRRRKASLSFSFSGDIHVNQPPR